MEGGSRTGAGALGAGAFFGKDVEWHLLAVMTPQDPGEMA